MFGRGEPSRESFLNVHLSSSCSFFLLHLLGPFVFHSSIIIFFLSLIHVIAIFLYFPILFKINFPHRPSLTFPLSTSPSLFVLFCFSFLFPVSSPSRLPSVFHPSSHYRGDVLIPARVHAGLSLSRLAGRNSRRRLESGQTSKQP